MGGSILHTEADLIVPSLPEPAHVTEAFWESLPIYVQEVRHMLELPWFSPVQWTWTPFFSDFGTQRVLQTGISGGQGMHHYFLSAVLGLRMHGGLNKAASSI